MAVCLAALAGALCAGELLGTISSKSALSLGLLPIGMGLAVLGFLMLKCRQQMPLHMGYLMLLFGIAYWYVLPGLSYILASDRSLGDRYGRSVSRESIVAACFYIGVFMLVAVVSYWAVYPTIARRFHRKPLRAVPHRLPFVLIGLFIMGLIPYLIFAEGISDIIKNLMAARSTTSAWKSEGALGDHKSAIYYFCVSGFVAAGGFAGTWAIFVQRAGLARRFLLTIFITTTLIMYFDGGTRSWVALVVIPTFLVWATKIIRGKITTARVAMAIVIICSVQVAFEIARASRMRGWSRERLSQIDFSERKFDNDFIKDLAMSVELVPDQHPYFYTGDLVAFVSHPVPRFLWSGKPISPILLYYNDETHAGLLKNKGNKLPSHLGQFYMSGGVIGIVLIGVIAALISCYGSILISSPSTGHQHIGSLIAVWWFLMSRGVYPGWTYPVLFNLLILFVGFQHSQSREAAPE